MVGRYPTVVQTAIKSLTIDTLEPNVPYTVQVDAYFPIDGKDVAKTFANVSFGPIRGKLQYAAFQLSQFFLATPFASYWRGIAQKVTETSLVGNRQRLQEISVPIQSPNIYACAIVCYSA